MSGRKLKSTIVPGVTFDGIELKSDEFRIKIKNLREFIQSFNGHFLEFLEKLKVFFNGESFDPIQGQSFTAYITQLKNDDTRLEQLIDELEESLHDDYYTKTDIDDQITNYYTKQEIDSVVESIGFDVGDLQTNKADKTDLNNYYTKTETDSKFDDDYTKSYLNPIIDDVNRYCNNLGALTSVTVPSLESRIKTLEDLNISSSIDDLNSQLTKLSNTVENIRERTINYRNGTILWAKQQFDENGDPIKDVDGNDVYVYYGLDMIRLALYLNSDLDTLFVDLTVKGVNTVNWNTLKSKKGETFVQELEDYIKKTMDEQISN